MRIIDVLELHTVRGGKAEYYIWNEEKKTNICNV